MLIATDAAPKLSNTSKMPGLSWSTEAFVTCPGARENGLAVAACKVCYARKGFYRMSNVKATRYHNMEDWKHPGWVEAMVKEVDNHRWFRWFDSGDMYDIRLARKILAVMQRTPHTNHWLPTRQYKFVKFHDILRLMNELDNVVVRLSSDSVTGETIDYPEISPYNSVIASEDDQVAGFLCEASKRGGKCGDCRACWSKEVATVTYPKK
jgi:hypothetical protein